MRPLSDHDDTCWTLITEAAAGDETRREEFVRFYEPIVRAYLVARWRGGSMLSEVDDAVQELFLDVLRPEGALQRFERGRGAGFRAFLHGVTRNVARRMEQRRSRSKERPGAEAFDADACASDEDSAGTVFDRSWARALLRQAAERQAQQARGKGEAAMERVRLLRQRFEDGLPIREIARRWGADPARLHHAYAAARKDFLRCLGEVVGFHDPAADPEAVERECLRLIELTR